MPPALTHSASPHPKWQPHDSWPSWTRHPGGRRQAGHSPFGWLMDGHEGLNEYESPPPPPRGASPIAFLHTSPSLERLLRIKCKSHIYWYESDRSVTFSQQRVYHSVAPRVSALLWLHLGSQESHSQPSDMGVRVRVRVLRTWKRAVGSVGHLMPVCLALWCPSHSYF